MESNQSVHEEIVEREFCKSSSENGPSIRNFIDKFLDNRGENFFKFKKLEIKTFNLF